VFETPTISLLARRIENDERIARSLVVRIREGNAPPLVLIHGGGGSVAAYGELARELKEERAILGVEARGFDDDAEPQTSIEEMAATYLAALPVPHILAGWSLGGTIAFEMARQSRAPRVVLIDAPHPGLEQSLPDDFAIPPEIDADRVARWRALLTAQLRALARYEPAPFDGEVVLLRAAHASTALRWHRFAPRLRVIEVPGDHHSMLRTPHVEALARALESVL
jgi:thioesterase domain-containing protein